MKCPDCGNVLAEVRFGFTGAALRCFRCGGFWIDSESANSMTSASLSSWRRISVDPVWFKGGKGLCPQDGMVLTRYAGDSVPVNVLSYRCVRCGKWWFPGDSLFVFKSASDAKANYLRLWGMGTMLSRMGLPVLLGALLLGGIWSGVRLTKNRLAVSISAGDIVADYEAKYKGEGEAAVVLEGKNEGVEVTYLRKYGEKKWEEAGVVCGQEICLVEMTGVKREVLYELVWKDKVLKVMVR